MVSTVSFAFAQQDEVDDAKKGGKSLAKDHVKKGSGVKLDGNIKTGDGSTPNPAKLSSHETGVATADRTEGMGKGKAKKGSFWTRLFGKKDAKEKKEE